MNITKKIWVSATKEYNKNHKRISVSGTKQQVKTRLIKSAGKRRTAYYLVKVSAGLTLVAGLVAVGYYYHHKKYTPTSDEFWDSDDDDDDTFDDDIFSSPTPKRTTPKRRTPPKLPPRPKKKEKKKKQKSETISSHIDTIIGNEQLLSNTLKNVNVYKKLRLIHQANYEELKRFTANDNEEGKIYKLTTILLKRFSQFKWQFNKYVKWYTKNNRKDKVAKNPSYNLEFTHLGYLLTDLQGINGLLKGKNTEVKRLIDMYKKI